MAKCCANTLSNPYFYRSILNKYRAGKSRNFMFPAMIFYRNQRRISSKKTNMDILVQLYFYYKNMMPSVIEKGIQRVKESVLNVRTMKHIPTFIPGPVLLENKKDVISGFESMKLLQIKVLQPLFSETGDGMYSQAKYQQSNSGDFLQIMTPQAQRKISNIKLEGSFSEKFNNKAGTAPFMRQTVYKTGSEDFFLHKRSKIEQELEEIKKIMVKTKDVVEEKPVSIHSQKDRDVPLHVDINRISDQVYQNIERKIWAERERRGL